MKQSPYVLLTSAFNEEKYIEGTIQSVLSQTLLPLHWMIISDGSTDRTDSLICQYQKLHDFISYIRVDHDSNEQEPKIGRIAWRKVNALSKGLARLASFSYDYICNIDADVSFGPSFFETLIERFRANPQLGIGGGFIYNVIDGKLIPHFVNERNVGGALQCFRKECFVDVGGYARYAHEDTVALIMARMRGWSTRSFSDLPVQHHKTVSCTGRLRYKAKYGLGTYDYVLGDTLVWEILRCVKEIRDTPYVLGSCLRFTGYIKALLSEHKLLPPEVQQFVRKEQYQLLRRAACGRF